MGVLPRPESDGWNLRSGVQLVGRVSTCHCCFRWSMYGMYEDGENMDVYLETMDLMVVKAGEG